jgi:hypothetical protein
MNTLELNAQAEGILTYLKAHTTDPREGLAILGVALCMIYDTCVDHSTCPFTKFAKDFHDSLIATEGDKSMTGPGTLQ